MIFLKINCPNFSRLVWRCHTKFQIGMAAAIPAIPLSAPLIMRRVSVYSRILSSTSPRHV